MRTLLPLSAALLLAVLGLAQPAHAAPAAGGALSHTGLAFGGRVVVGGGIQIPIGRAYAPESRRVEEVGYWETRYREVQVYHPGRLLAYDRFGRAMYSEGYYTIEQQPYQVWVVERRVERVRPRVRPVGFLSLGGAWRVR